MENDGLEKGAAYKVNPLRPNYKINFYIFKKNVLCKNIVLISYVVKILNLLIKKCLITLTIL